MLTILTARAGGGQLNTLLDRIGRTPGKQILIIPEQYSHETERALCSALPPAGSARCEVLSMTRLARRLAEYAGGAAQTVLDAGGRVLLMYAAVKEVSEQLTVYRKPSRRPSFLSGLIATVDECKSYRVSPESLTQAGELLSGNAGNKLRDIGLIYGAYDALTARACADPRDRLDQLAAQLASSDWASQRTVWVWGFTDFTAQEGAVLGQLMYQSPGVTVALTLDEADEDPSGIFTPAKRTLAYLRRLARNAGVEVRREVLPYQTSRTPSLTHLEQNLFALLPEPWEGTGDISLLSASDPRTEVEHAAAEILRLVREKGFRFRDIAVCARSFDSYIDLVESVFGRCGIPVFLSKTTDILQKPVLALVTSALDCAGGGYRGEDVFRYLKTGLTGLDAKEQDLLENYALTWDIQGSRWTQSKPWNMHPQGYGAQWSESSEKLVAWLDGLRRRLIAPLEKLRKTKRKTGRGYAMALYQCLEEIDLPARFAQRANTLEEQGNPQWAEEYRQLWEILCGGLEQCASLLDETPMELEEFSNLFQLVLSQYDVSSIPVSLDQVTAGECTRMAGRAPKALFLLGADSGAIPQAVPSPGLFSDHDRDLLAEFDLTLAPRLEDKLRREMTIVYETCAAPSQKLYVSWAAGTGADGERSPSFLVERLREMFPGVTDLGKEPVPLCAKGQALERAGSDPIAAAALKTLPQWSEAVERVLNARRWRRGKLSRLGTEALYGAMVPLSATKLDQLAQCHFAYFMRYGLKARPRTQAKFQATDYGTFMHYILESVLAQDPQSPEQLSQLISDPDLRALRTSEAAQRYIDEALQGMEGESGRFRYLFGRMSETAGQVVDDVAAELGVSEFRPVAFELGFGVENSILPPVTAENGVKVSLSGKVDRVDAWLHEGKRYLRVIDYKTGRKSFDFTDLQNGLGLQMLLYLSTLRKEGQKVFGPEPILPAGVLYLPAHDPVVDGKRSMSPEEIGESVGKELVRKGLVLDDPAVIDAMEHAVGGKYRYLPLGGRSDSAVNREQMEQLEGLVEDKLHQAAGELSEGNIDADPYWRGKDNCACRWCDYAWSCHFEEACGDKYRKQRRRKSKEFWDSMKEETQLWEDEYGD